MEILIVGKSGMGKSNLADILKAEIFKRDRNCTISTNDLDREHKTLGHGNSPYNITVSRELPTELSKFDITIQIHTPALKSKLDLLNS